jgi:hypothetical protein
LLLRAREKERLEREKERLTRRECSPRNDPILLLLATVVVVEDAAEHVSSRTRTCWLAGWLAVAGSFVVIGREERGLAKPLDSLLLGYPTTNRREGSWPTGARR